MRVGPRERALKTRAETLLRSLVAAGSFTLDRVATVLDVDPDAVEELASGQQVMSLPQQLALATFVIEHVPALSRRGHALRVQVSAAADFHSHRTSTHSGPPARWPRQR